MTATFAVGRDCDARCTRCKMELAHTIVAMVQGLPVQVKCNTCGGVHKYRGPKGSTPARKRASSSKATSGRRSTRGGAGMASAAASSQPTGVALETIRRRWDEHLARLAGEPSARYRVTESYAVDDVIEHPKFGLGFVLREIGFNRINVLFSDGERVLVNRHGQRPPGAIQR